MKIERDWKNFENEKPIVSSKVIFKRGDELILGVYDGDVSSEYPRNGIWKDERKFPVYRFIGRKISYKKTKKLSYPIYTPFSYSNGYNPYNFEWDYYN